MICEREHKDAPLRCWEDDGTPISPTDERVLAQIEAESLIQPQAPKILPVLPVEITEARYAACLVCNLFIKSTDRCKACGCADTMRRRSTSLYATCPMGQWAPLPPASPTIDSP